MTPADLIQALRQFRCNGAYVDICLQAAAVIETYEAELNDLEQSLDKLGEQVKMLRDALMFCQSKIAFMLRNGEWYNPELALDTAREALSATEPKP